MEHPKQINGMDVIRVADVDDQGTPILADGESAVEQNGIFYVVGQGIELQ